MIYPRFINVFIFLTAYLLAGCTSETPIAGDPGWKLLDLRAFTIEVPILFEYEELRGIDSYVGVITDGSTRIHFDYGWYSNGGPETAIDFWIEKGRVPQFSSLGQRITDLRQDSTKGEDVEIQLISVVTLPPTELSGGLYEVGLTMEGDTHFITTNLTELDLYGDGISRPDEDGSLYSIVMNFDGCAYRKTYTATNQPGRCGLLLFEDCDYHEKKGMLTQLGIFVDGYSIGDEGRIRRILRSVIFNVEE